MNLRLIKPRISTILAGVLIVLFMLLGAHVYAASVPAPTNIPMFEKFEAAFTLENQSGNPFDPGQNDIDVQFVTPNRQVIAVPAFWDGNTWRVRFTPEGVGLYAWRVERNGVLVQAMTNTPSEFNCLPSADPGFIRRDPDKTQRFRFDNGLVYYPFGTDVAWMSDDSSAYPNYFANMRSSKMNWARVWMTSWDGKALEWSEDSAQSPAIGTFSLAAARKWDAIFDSAAQNGVYIQMTLQYHGQYTMAEDSNWQSNPFNIANGGFLSKPDDFFTDPRAIALTKAKYRYIVARWGYSTNLFAFELFNEVQNIREAQSHFQDVVAWHRTMTDYIRSIDPYRHLITTSNSVPGEPLASIGLDFDQQHIYAPDLATAFQALPIDKATAPYFVGEWGPIPDSPLQRHLGIWSGIMSPTAGAAQYWYWDKVAQNSLWPQFASAGAFLETGHFFGLGLTQYMRGFGKADGPLADLTFAPALGWAPNTSYDITLQDDGRVTGADGVSTFLQGTYHSDLRSRPIVFHLDLPAACQLTVDFDTVSASGAHPMLQLQTDPSVTADRDYPPSAAAQNVNDSLTLDVPAGPQTVELTNTGSDWVTIGQIRITNCTSPVILFAKGSDKAAMFYAGMRGGSAAGPMQNGRAVLRGLTDGRYAVHVWSIDASTWLPVLTARSIGGSLTVPLPNVVEAAGIVTPSE